jgi:hypothetical protein
MMDEKLHYYLISFSFTDTYRKESGFASSRMGWVDKYINEPRIEEAKRAVCPSTNATPISVSYLGHMTKDFMRGEDA